MYLIKRDISIYYLLLFVIIPFFSSNSQQIQKSTNYSQNASISNPVIKIMPLGDSITKGTDHSEDSDRTGYRRKLYLDLLHSGQNINFVGSQERGTPEDFDKEHEGHGSFRAKFSDTSLSLVDNVMNYLDQFDPDIILLHIGTNDIGNGEDAEQVKNEINEVLDNIDLWEQVNSKQIVVFLAQIIKIISTGTEADRIIELNAKLDTLANQRIINGDQIVLVNLESALNYVDDMGDGYHPNNLGYEKLARVWYSSLMDYFPKLNLRIFMEGAILQNPGMQMSTELINFLPSFQPFNTPGLEMFSNDYFSPPYGITDFIESYNIVDWLLVELRSDILISSQVYQRSVLVDKNGYLFDMDGTNGVKFGGLNPGEYYIVVSHNNHLSIMSSSKILIQ